MGNGDAFNPLKLLDNMPRAFIIAIQLIVLGFFVGVWWVGNENTKVQVISLKESIDKLRGEISANTISKRDDNDLIREINWRLRRLDKKIGIDHQDIPLYGDTR